VVVSEEQEHAEIESAAKDPRRFTVLYERYFADIFRFLLRRCTDRDLCNDLVQETFLKAMLALPRYQHRGLPFRAWLYRIALNELRMHWRKRKEVLIDLNYVQVGGLTEEMGLLLEDDDLRRLALAMGKLDVERSHLIHLRYMDGMSFAEIGQVIGVAEDAAKMRVHRILNTLRTYLAPRA
jgi:RNA polymerase sigma-70 factor, ECF subfamily